MITLVYVIMKYIIIIHVFKIFHFFLTMVDSMSAYPLAFGRITPSAHFTCRHCWVCFATEREDRVAEWVSPCRCRGCTKWIHQNCLQRWLDEKQKGNGGGAVSCPQCGTEYSIVFPKMGT